MNFLRSLIALLTICLVGCTIKIAPQVITPPTATEIPTDVTVPLFEGITYRKQIHQTPRPLVIHIVTVDLTAPGIRLFVTPGDKKGGVEISSRTTSEFLTEFDAQVAINGSFFAPFRSNATDDYYPRRGDSVDILGLAISDGVTYSTSQQGMGVLCVLADNQAQIQPQSCPADSEQALAGSAILVNQGTPISNEDLSGDALHPRTAVAIDKLGQTLWLIVVDGRQPGYSEGIALVELAKGIQDLGAYTALNLDGGGSTALVVEDGASYRILNRPIDSRIPMRERPVGNHLGIYARPFPR